MRRHAPFRFLPALALLAVVPLAGCDFSDEGGPRIEASGEARQLPADDDDVFSIVTRDDLMKLGLTEEVVYMRFSDEQLRKIDTEMAEETSGDEGIAGRITSAVTGAISKGLRTRVSYDLDNVRDIYWERGRLVVELQSGDPAFGDMEVEESDVMTQFSEDDAQAFIEAWREVRDAAGADGADGADGASDADGTTGGG